MPATGAFINPPELRKAILMFRSFFNKYNIAVLLSAVEVMTAAAAGTVNIVYGLGVESVADFGTAVIFSVIAVVIYIAAAVSVFMARRRDVAVFQLVWWAIALFGFIFYACDKLFNIPIITPAINMTAFIRFMTVLFTLPVMAYNTLITLPPFVWLRFALAIIFPLGMTVFYSAVTARVIKNERKTKDIPADNSGGTL